MMRSVASIVTVVRIGEREFARAQADPKPERFQRGINGTEAT